MVAPFAKVMPNKVTLAVTKFINKGDAEFKNVMKATVEGEMAKGADRSGIVDKLRLTFFMATIPIVVNEQTANLGMAPYLLKLFALQIEKVDWDYVLDSVMRTNSPELN